MWHQLLNIPAFLKYIDIFDLVIIMLILPFKDCSLALHGKMICQHHTKGFFYLVSPFDCSHFPLNKECPTQLVQTQEIRKQKQCQCWSYEAMSKSWSNVKAIRQYWSQEPVSRPQNSAKAKTKPKPTGNVKATKWSKSQEEMSIP